MLLTGKRFVVTGIASKLSIAWGIAEALHREGASLILTYPNEKMKKRVDMAAETFGAEKYWRVMWHQIAKSKRVLPKLLHTGQRALMGLCTPLVLPLPIS